MKTTLIVDGDMLAFTAVSSTTEEVEWEPFMWSYWTDLAAAQAHYDNALARLVEAAEADEVAVAMSSAINFRKALYDPYKSGRGRKPLGYAAFRESILAQPTTWMREGLEGDDIIGILMTRTAHDMGVRIQWSGDKDLKQIPGLRLDRDLKIEEVTPAEGNRWHAIQTLSGDVTDGYPGLPGFGLVSAKVLVDTPTMLDPYDHVMARGPRKGETETRYTDVPTTDTWGAIEQRYRLAGQSREDMLVQARVARILQAPDYDFTARKVIPWTP